MNNLDKKKVSLCLEHMIDFLKPYLSVANAHAAHFITRNQWEMLPRILQEDLLQLTDDQLRMLPLSAYCDSDLSACSQTKRAVEDGDTKWLCRDHNTEQFSGNLEEFCELAKSYSLEGMSLHTTKDDFLQEVQSSIDSNSVGAHMNAKKCHEVEIMSEICASVVRCTRCQLVNSLFIIKKIVLCRSRM